VAYSIQAPGPHGPVYRLAGLPVSCCQLEANAGTVHGEDEKLKNNNNYALFKA